ncbi:MAG: VCBS repeat-containing protein [Bifidobacteriaceae bacterium]|jgi:hypothetical protein|nr:VCBS repeat-containing protein [Bifidobacteriaceae bacterium]
MSHRVPLHIQLTAAIGLAAVAMLVAPAAQADPTTPEPATAATQAEPMVTDHESEENGTFASANRIQYGRNMAAQMYADGGACDVDYFYLTTLATGPLRITFEHADFGAPANSDAAWIRVYDSSGVENSSTRLAAVTSTFGDTVTTILLPNLEQGGYIIKIQACPSFGASWNQPYTITTGPAHLRLALSPDLTGDGLGEILALRWDGTLLQYASKGNGQFANAVTLATGLGASWISGPGDWDGDKKADVVTVDQMGNMWLRAGDGRGGISPTPIQIGRGWLNYRIIPAGDLDRDGINDMLAVDQAGKLWLYCGNGRGAFKEGRREVGHGWQSMQLLAAGDLDKDGRNDILGINAQGILYAYSGKGDGSFKAAKNVGHGWAGRTLAAGADLTGDGLADIVGRNDETTELFFYKSKGGGQFAAALRVSSGW